MAENGEQGVDWFRIIKIWNWRHTAFMLLVAVVTGFGLAWRGDDADGAGGCHALVVPVDGEAPGHDAQLRQPGVAVARPQAAPDPDLQAEQRPALVNAD